MAYQPKNYKKFVATAATATLVATAIAPAALADQASTSAFTDVGDRYEQAVEYVVSNNISSGLTATKYGVSNSITRGDAAVMVAKAAGLMDEEAPNSGFSDVPARGAVAVNSLKAAGVINGISDTKFGFSDEISRGQAAYMLAQAFDLTGGDASDLDFTDVGENHRFAEEVAALVENNITSGVTPTSFGIDQDIKRGDFAIFLYRLSELVEPAPGTPEVASVSAINAKEVQVQFTTPVAKSTVLDSNNVVKNISFSTVGTATPTGVLTGTLSTDGKTLTVTAADSFNGSYTVVATDSIETVEGDAIEEFKSVVTLSDSVRPSVGQAVYNSNNVATFSFSEPIDVANNAALSSSLTLKDASGATFTPVVNLAADKKSFTLDLNGPTFTTGKTYTLTVASLRDFAGNLIAPNPVALSVEKKVVDDVVPTVSSISSNQAGYVVVNFSEKVSVNTNNEVAVVGGVTADLDTNATLNAAGTVLTVRAASFNGIKDIAVSNFSDVAGNLGTTRTVLVNFPVDSVNPTVASNTVKTINNQNYLVLTFSEDVSVTNAAGSITGTYVTENGVEKTVSAIDTSVAANVSLVDGSKNQVKVLIDSQEKGNYSVSLPANLVNDVVGNPNAVASQTYTVGVNTSETTKPTIVDANPLTADLDGITIQAADNNTVEIEFSETLATSSLNLNNFLVEGATIASKAVFTDTDRDTIRLTLKEGAIRTSGTYNFTVRNVADVAGNLMNSVTQSKAFTENKLPGLTSAVLTSNEFTSDVNGSSVITLTFDEAIDAGSIVETLPEADFGIFLNNTALSNATVVETMGTSTNQVLLTVDRALSATEAAQTITLKPTADFEVTDLEGNLHPTFTSVTVTK